MYWPYLCLKFTVHPVCVFVVLLSSLYTRFVTEHTCFSEKHWNVGFVNFGRGNVIDDVIYALDNKFSAAVHDVFNVETLPKSSQLWTHSNVTITPHVAGVSRAQDVADCFKNNLDKFDNNFRMFG